VESQERKARQKAQTAERFSATGRGRSADNHGLLMIIPLCGQVSQVFLLRFPMTIYWDQRSRNRCADQHEL
jgi:hypothetical protein